MASREFVSRENSANARPNLSVRTCAWVRVYPNAACVWVRVCL